MSLSVEQMRAEISKVYTSLSWKNKVKKMSDSQVMAVYQNFINNGRFSSKAK